MTARPAVPIFGIPELDRRLEPDLPKGWLGLVEGVSGAGTHLVAKQFANAGLGSLPVLYYTTSEPTEEVRRAFRDFGWDPAELKIGNLDDEYYERVLRRQLERSKLRERGLSLKDLAEGTPDRRGAAHFGIPSRLLADLAQLEGPFRLVLDSLDFLLEVLPPAEVSTLARQIHHRAQRLSGQALLIVQGGIHDRRWTGLMEDMADLVVELAVDAVGESYRHILTVRKIRNHPERTQRVACVVTEHGLALDSKAAKGGKVAQE
jgi:KaiC/GvpD/RAD55 family RecA-like ATPase